MTMCQEWPRGRALVFKKNGMVALDTREMLLELGFADVAVAARGEEAIVEILTMRPQWAVIDAGHAPEELEAIIAALNEDGVPFVLICNAPDGSDIPEQWQGRPYLARPYSKAELEALAPLRV